MHTLLTSRPVWSQQTLLPENDPAYFTDQHMQGGELEKKAELLIARCHQLLAEMKEKRDNMKLPY